MNKGADHKNAGEFEKLSVAVDVLIFTVDDNHVEVLLERRDDEPFRGSYALPGALMEVHEDLEETVARCLKEEIGIDDIYTEQLYTWGELNRDPRRRVISVSYIALVNKSRCHPVAGERVSEVIWKEVSKANVDELRGKLAYDHGEMIAYALERLSGKVEYTSIAFHMMGEEFTLPALQHVYEILLGKPLYKANFRKKIAEFVEETGGMVVGDPHRPSKLYRWNGR
ncbi:MAG: NUDIX hydrolase [Lachnospiraceae bacterium]|nr:NUDIX hydrolase [Lachnospiraceae bacterium]